MRTLSRVLLELSSKAAAFLAAALVLTAASCASGNGTEDFAEGVNDIPDLAGKSVSVISGSVQDFAVEKLPGNTKILRFSSDAELLTAVESGKSDYCLTDSASIIGAGIEDRGMKVAFTTDKVSGLYGIGFSYDDSELHSQFNSYLAELSSSGELDTILKNWTQGDVASAQMAVYPFNPEWETLKVGLSVMFPFDFVQNGRFVGLEPDLICRFAEGIQHNVEFVVMDFSALIAALVTDKVDIICSAMFITEERSKKVLFSDSYYHSNAVCVCRDVNGRVKSESLISKAKDSFKSNLIEEDRWKLIVDGLYETLIISFFSIIFGTLFGCFVCWMRMSKSRLLRETAKIYVDIIRGVPILVLLMLMFYVVFASGGVSARWVAIIAFAMNFGAYVSEMYRTGIEGVDRGQTEAGLAMGFSPLKTFILFVIPQAAKNVIPVFKGEAVSLIKNTSVVGFIAIQDLTKASEIIRSRTFDAFFPLIIISIIYFILAYLLGKLLDALAKKIA